MQSNMPFVATPANYHPWGVLIVARTTSNTPETRCRNFHTAREAAIYASRELTLWRTNVRQWSIFWEHNLLLNAVTDWKRPYMPRKITWLDHPRYMRRDFFLLWRHLDLILETIAENPLIELSAGDFDHADLWPTFSGEPADLPTLSIYISTAFWDPILHPVNPDLVDHDRSVATAANVALAYLDSALPSCNVTLTNGQEHAGILQIDHGPAAIVDNLNLRFQLADNLSHIASRPELWLIAKKGFSDVR